MNYKSLTMYRSWEHQSNLLASIHITLSAHRIILMIFWKHYGNQVAPFKRHEDRQHMTCQTLSNVVDIGRYTAAADKMHVYYI